MRIVNITRAFILSADCTEEILLELAEQHVKMPAEQVAKLKESQPSKTELQALQLIGVQHLQFGKLRIVVAQALADNPDYDAAFNEGKLELEIAALPDLPLDINAAGKNKGAGAPRKASMRLTGAYKVVNKNGFKGNEQSDPGKWQIWQHVFNCATFEEYFAKCPPKGVTKTGRIITASSEMLWAVKSGWIKPVADEQQPAEQQQPEVTRQQENVTQ